MWCIATFCSICPDETCCPSWARVLGTAMHLISKLALDLSQCLLCGCHDEMTGIPSGAPVNARPPADTRRSRAYAVTPCDSVSGSTRHRRTPSWSGLSSFLRETSAACALSPRARTRPSSSVLDSRLLQGDKSLTFSFQVGLRFE